MSVELRCTHYFQCESRYSWCVLLHSRAAPPCSIDPLSKFLTNVVYQEMHLFVSLEKRQSRYKCTIIFEIWGPHATLLHNIHIVKIMRLYNPIHESA